MRRLLIAAVTSVATAMTMRVVKRLLRPRVMEHKKVEELQDKFRGLDTVEAPKTSSQL